MSGFKRDRKKQFATFPVPPSDKARVTLALARLGNALGVQLDASRPDHEILEQLAERTEHHTALGQRLAEAYRQGLAEGEAKMRDRLREFLDGE